MTDWTKATTPTTPPRAEVNVLDEAKRLVHGARNHSYGPPTEDFARTAAMLTALFRDRLQPGKGFEPADVARILICVKLSRSIHTYKRDNWVDVAGYAETADWCEAPTVD